MAADLKLCQPGDVVYEDAYGPCTSEGFMIVTSVFERVDEHGITFKVIQCGKKRWDSRTGYSTNPKAPSAYFISACTNDPEAAAKDPRYKDLFAKKKGKRK